MPACAAYAASDAEVLPVDAQATAVAPMRRAWVTPTVIPRSLNEPVGLWPSCLSSRWSAPVQRSSAGRWSSGVLPSGWETTSSADGSTISRKRQTPDADAPGRCPRRSVKRSISSARVSRRRAVADLEQAAAGDTARMGIELGHLVAAGEADLPAHRPLRLELHPDPPVDSISRAPTTVHRRHPRVALQPGRGVRRGHGRRHPVARRRARA